MRKQLDPEQEKEDELIRGRIKQAIASKGMKLKQFARESGMAYPSLRDYYSGLRKPGFDAIATLLRFTGVSAEWLLLGKGEMLPDAEALMANLDEGLLGRIAKEVERADRISNMSAEDAEAVREDGNREYEYSPARRELHRQLVRAATNGVISGSVYNRVAFITDDRRLDNAIIREVNALVRMNRNLSAFGEG